MKNLSPILPEDDVLEIPVDKQNKRSCKLAKILLSIGYFVLGVIFGVIFYP